MPYKDPKKQSVNAAKYRREQYMPLSLNIRNDSGIPNALFKMQDRTGTPLATYALTALREKLAAEGYLQNN